MTELGVGIIGCGNISTAYLRLAPLFRGYVVRAVADIDVDRAASQAEAFGVRMETVERLLDANDIDVIVNLTIPEAHYEVSCGVLEAGKHCYSEKPFVLSLAEGRRLQEIAASRRLRVGSAPDTFLGGAHQEARALVDRGAIGRVLGGTAHVMSRGMEHWHPNPDFFFQPGGGPVLDLGPYYITNLVQLLGPIRAVSATASTGFPDRVIGAGPRQGEAIAVETPTTVHAHLEFEGGAVVTFGASWDVTAHAHSHMELYGSEGTLVVPDPNYFGGLLSLLTGNDGSVEHAPVDHPFAVPNQGEEVRVANYRGAGLADMALAITDDRPHRCNGELALHVVEVLTGILWSAEEQKRVEISTRADRPEPLTAKDAERLLRVS